eukprot:scaffold180106_cov32-Tisochrysis_lutea.AAC.2
MPHTWSEGEGLQRREGGQPARPPPAVSRQSKNNFGTNLKIVPEHVRRGATTRHMHITSGYHSEVDSTLLRCSIEMPTRSTSRLAERCPAGIEPHSSPASKERGSRVSKEGPPLTHTATGVAKVATSTIDLPDKED